MERTGIERSECTALVRQRFNHTVCIQYRARDINLLTFVFVDKVASLEIAHADKAVEATTDDVFTVWRLCSGSKRSVCLRGQRTQVSQKRNRDRDLVHKERVDLVGVVRAHNERHEQTRSTAQNA
jgi:hypothetical protein